MTAETTTRSYVMFSLKGIVWLLMTIMILVTMFDDKSVMWSDRPMYTPYIGPGRRVGMFTAYGISTANVYGGWDTPAFLDSIGVGVKVGLGIQGCTVVALLMTQLSLVFYTIAVFGAGNHVALRTVVCVLDALAFTMCVTVTILVSSATTTARQPDYYDPTMGNAVALLSSAALLAFLSPFLSWCLSEAPFSCCCQPIVQAYPYPVDGYATFPTENVRSQPEK
ncbi:hypothetical protein DIPPA_02415 [Diplonema papillatum]|nr:hypothetical protein DIPPA_02415 [Diplonema papillatum]